MKKLRVKYKLNLLAKRILKKMILLRNRLMIDYGSIKIGKKKFNIILNERFEKSIKNVSRVILVANIILAFVFIPFPYNIALTLFLILIEQIIERIVFSFVSAFVAPPLPSLELWHKASFEAAVLGGHRYREEPGTVGMYFSNEDEAREVFKFVRSWNFDRDEDLGTEPYIRITFVINRKKDRYAMFVSPTIPDNAFEKLRHRRMDKIKEGKEPWVFIQAMIMCKVFNFKNSGLEHFLQFYEPGYEYDFAFYSGDPRMPQIIKDTKPIRKNKLNIFNIEDLTQKDIELFMCKYNIDWDDDSPVAKSTFWYK